MSPRSLPTRMVVPRLAGREARPAGDRASRGQGPGSGLNLARGHIFMTVFTPRPPSPSALTGTCRRVAPLLAPYLGMLLAVIAGFGAHSAAAGHCPPKWHDLTPGAVPHSHDGVGRQTLPRRGLRGGRPGGQAVWSSATGGMTSSVPIRVVGGAGSGGWP
jgi:hypothetical protein